MTTTEHEERCSADAPRALCQLADFLVRWKCHTPGFCAMFFDSLSLCLFVDSCTIQPPSIRTLRAMLDMESGIFHRNLLSCVSMHLSRYSSGFVTRICVRAHSIGRQVRISKEANKFNDVGQTRVRALVRIHKPCHRAGHHYTDANSHTQKNHKRNA